MSAIPARTLRELNAGRDETITLVEWLAVDIHALARAVLPQVGLVEGRRDVLTAAARLSREGVTRRTRGMGRAIHRALDGNHRRAAVLEALASHRSDVVRSWAAYAVAAADHPSLAARLVAARRFAADPHMSVRECAWETFRFHVAADLPTGLRLLRRWVIDPDANVRRCAIEATRPRGVWTHHIEALKEDPSRAAPLLEPVRSDPSRYVQRAVANWINDASKTRPGWARALCARWKKDSPTPETAWIVNHALRTLRTSERRRAPPGSERRPPHRSITLCSARSRSREDCQMAWSNVADSAGNHYRLFTQEKSQSCGVACTMMILKLLQNKEIDEGTCRGNFTKAEGTSNVDHTGHRSFDAAGTTQSPIISVLSKYKISSNQVAPAYVGKWIKEARPSRPVILGVDWGVSGVGQGGHWVVCVQYGTQLVCLDPWYGLIESSARFFPFYFVDASTRGRINDLIQIA